MWELYCKPFEKYDNFNKNFDIAIANINVELWDDDKKCFTIKGLKRKEMLPPKGLEEKDLLADFVYKEERYIIYEKGKI